MVDDISRMTVFCRIELTQRGSPIWLPSPEQGHTYPFSWGASAAPHRSGAPASITFEVTGEPELCFSVAKC